MTTMDSPVLGSRVCYTPAFYPVNQSVNRSEGQSAQPCMSLQGEPLPDKVFVGGLAEKTTEQDLRTIFEAHCPVESVKIITDKSLMSKNGEPRRYAFIQFQSVEDAKKVLEVYGESSREGSTTLEIHGRRLNIGSAFKKTPTFGRVFGPGLVPQVMTADPYQMYHPYGPYAAYLAGPKSPLPAGLQGAPQYYMPYGYGPQSPYIIQQQAPPSPTMMRNGPYITPGAGHLAGGASPGASHGMTTQMAYQLASSMLNHQSPVSPGVLTDLDCSYLNSSSSSSSRHGAADRSTDRFQYGPAPPLAQLPSGHVEQRERNGRAIHIPQPVRVTTGQSSSPYLNGPVSPGMTSDGYLAPGMRHQYVQH